VERMYHPTTQGSGESAPTDRALTIMGCRPPTVPVLVEIRLALPEGFPFLTTNSPCTALIPASPKKTEIPGSPRGSRPRSPSFFSALLLPRNVNTAY
jgi:hypothetical protein